MCRPRLRRAALGAVLGVLLVACRHESPPLAPTLRLIDAPGIARPGEILDWGVGVTIADETRPVLSATHTTGVLLVPSETVPADGPRRYPVGIPDGMRGASCVLLEPQAWIHERWERQPPRIVRPDRGETAAELVIAFPGLKAGDPTRVAAHARAVPPLEARDVTTGPLAIPRGAVLAFAIGVEQAAAAPGFPALEFTIEALDGDRPVPLFHRRLDPAGVPGDRTWQEEQASLDDVAGRTVRLRFAARASGAGEAGTSLPVWGDPVVLAPTPAWTRPNVLLISLDTLRAASVSAYGSARRTMPGLEMQLAARGTLFEQAIAPFPHTLPSHMSLFTGLYQRTHGVRGLFTSLSPDRPTLTERLRGAGYQTAAFTEDGFLNGELGFARGFGVYGENKSPELHEPEGQIRETFGKGTTWLDRHRGEPFFLFLHTYQVHHPYVPPPEYRGYFLGADAPSTPDEQQRLLYEQEIRYADDQLRDLLAHVDGLGLSSTTLVVVFGDHGEEFREHGQIHHGFQVFDESVRVPLVFRWPGTVPAGLRVAPPVSLVDVAPTILELAGLPPLPGVEGRSLVPLLRSGAGAPPETAVFSEAPSSPLAPSVDVTAARSATGKCIFHDATSAFDCYDLVADPGERRPLPADDPDPRIRGLREQVADFRRGAAKPMAAPATGVSSDPQTEQKLRALGYVE